MAYDKVVDSAKLEAGLTSIADAIRAHVADPGPPRVCQFPDGFVAGVADAYDAGRSVGHAEGSSVGYEVGLTDGAQSVYDEFWDRTQWNGNRTNYSQAFCGSMFGLPDFKPKYDMHVTNASYMFCWWNNNPGNFGYFELDLRNTGVTIDFSQCTSFQTTFQTNYQLTAIGVFDTRSATAFSNTFYYAIHLHTIEKLILKDDGSQTFSNTFLVCYDLENIVVEGKIGNAVSFVNSTKLTHDSLMSIIGALLDISGTGTTKTLTLGTTNLAKLTAAEKKIATDKGWTLA